MDITMLECCTSDSTIFDVAKFTTLSIIITYFVQTLIPNCWFENVFLPNLALKSPNKIFIWYFGNVSNTCSNSS
jgi:hypothetical protein